MTATVRPEATTNETATRKNPVADQRRDEGVTRLVLSGVSVREIGAAYGISTRGAVNRLVERALRSQLLDIDPELRRRVDHARLEALLRAWWDRALDGDTDAAAVVLATIELRAGLGGNAPGASEKLMAVPPNLNTDMPTAPIA
jgi:hypothetical protein